MTGPGRTDPATVPTWPLQRPVVAVRLTVLDPLDPAVAYLHVRNRFPDATEVAGVPTTVGFAARTNVVRRWQARLDGGLARHTVAEVAAELCWPEWIVAGLRRNWLPLVDVSRCSMIGRARRRWML